MNKKKLILIGLILAFLLALPACSSQQQTEETQESIVEETADGLAENDDSAYSLPVGEVPIEREVSVWDGSIADGFESGYGTSEEPYVIATASQLAYLSYLVNNGLDYEGQYYWLVCDIDLNYYVWTPIGNRDHPFCGHFGGNGHIISNLFVGNVDDNNLFISTPYDDERHDTVGLFGAAKNSTFDRLTLYSCYIAPYYEADVEEAEKSVFISYVGGLVGYLETEAGGTSSITNCLLIDGYIDSFIGQGYADSPYLFVGGLAGEIEGATIYGCCSSATIYAANYEGGAVGGIVACCEYGAIADCLALGDCHVDCGDYEQFVGGIAGEFEKSSMTNCMSGVVMITNNARVGGIAGKTFGYDDGRSNINDCFYSFETANQASAVVSSDNAVINNVQAVPPEYFTDPNHYNYYYGGNVVVHDDGSLWLEPMGL